MHMPARLCESHAGRLQLGVTLWKRFVYQKSSSSGQIGGLPLQQHGHCCYIAYFSLQVQTILCKWYVCTHCFLSLYGHKASQAFFCLYSKTCMS